MYLSSENHNPSPENFDYPLQKCIDFPHFCSNNGICKDIFGHLNCLCHSFYYGDRCQYFDFNKDFGSRMLITDDQFYQVIDPFGEIDETEEETKNTNKRPWNKISSFFTKIFRTPKE